MSIRRGALISVFVLSLSFVFLIFSRPASAAIIDATGVGCSAFGTWDAPTQTCTQNHDVSGNFVQITSPGITFDGGGYKISRGATSIIYGILVQASSTTIRNVNIQQFSNGINASSISNLSVSSSTLSQNTDNLVLTTVSGASIDGLTVVGKGTTTPGTGVELFNTTGVQTRNVSIQNHQHNFVVTGSQATHFENDIDTSNTSDGRPIYYVKNASNTSYDASTNAGIFYCISCNHVALQNLNLSRNKFGIFLYNTTDSTVDQVTISGSLYGISVLGGSNNTISNSTLSGNSHAINLQSSSNNFIEHNTINGFGNGVILSEITPQNASNVISDNTISGGTTGIQLTGTGNLAEGNTITGESTRGISFIDTASSGNTARDNTLLLNNIGIYLEGQNGAQIFGNTIATSTTLDIQLREVSSRAGCTNTRFFNNNIFNTSIKASGFCDGTTNTYSNALPAGGNYWSSFDTPAEGCTDADNNHICDTPLPIPSSLATAAKDLLPWTVASGWAIPTNTAPVLSDSTEPGYANDTTSPGVEPNRGVASATPFVFKVIYTDADNNPPAYLRINIDATEHDMAVDTSATLSALHDGNFANGEQYIYTSLFPKGEHPYFFVTSDNAESTRLPATESFTFRAGYSSVAFIPGHQASRLTSSGDLSNQLWEPNSNTDVERIYLDSYGQSIDSTIVTSGVVDEVLFPSAGGNVYKGFIAFMDNLVSNQIIHAWSALEYDWRKDLSDIVEYGVATRNGHYDMVTRIEQLASDSDSGKVVIVTHSNGGLVAKFLIDRLTREGKEELIEQLIMVAAPQIGTPKAVSVLLHGNKPGWMSFIKDLFMDSAHQRTLGENMVSAYNLMPSSEYFARVIDPVIEFDQSLDSFNNWRSVYGNNITTRTGLENFLRGVDGRVEPADTDILSANVLKPNLLTQSNSNQAILDSWTPPANIKFTQIAGWGLDTIRGIKYKTRTKNVCTSTSPTTPPSCSVQKYLDNEPLEVKQGDETVLGVSAKASLVETFYLNLPLSNRGSNTNRSHASILEVPDLRSFIHSILIGKASNTPPTIGLTEPSIPGKNLRLALHSPVNIDTTDSNNRKTNADQLDIPNSYYWEFGEGKYVGLDENDIYAIRLRGTDYGTFTLEIEELSGDTTEKTASFTDIPVSPQTTVTASLTNLGTPLVLNIDTNSDGKTDQQINSTIPVTPTDQLKTLSGIINTLSIDSGIKKSLLAKIGEAINYLQKGKIPEARAKLSDLENQINALTSKKFSQQTALNIIQIIEKIKTAL